MSKTRDVRKMSRKPQGLSFMSKSKRDRKTASKERVDSLSAPRSERYFTK